MKSTRRTTTKKPAPKKVPPKRPSRKKQRRFPLKFWILPALGLAGAIYGVSRLIGDATNAQDKAYRGAIERNKAMVPAKVIGVYKDRKGVTVHYAFSFHETLYENRQSDGGKQYQMHHCYTVALDSTNPARSMLVAGSERPCGDL